MRKITLVSTILASLLTLNPSAFAGAQDQSDENSRASQNKNFQQKKPANNKNHGGMNSHQDKVKAVTVREVPNDDIVGSRSGSNPTYKKPKQSSPTQANTTINCNHPAYKTLCAELKKAAEPAPAPKPKPPAIVYPKKNVWITTGDRSNWSARDLSHSLPIALSKMRPRKIRLNGSNNYLYNFNGNTQTHRRSYTVPSNAVHFCKSRNGAVSSCSAQISATKAYGCDGNVVTKYVSYMLTGQGGASCGQRRETDQLKFRVSKVEVMY